MCEEQDATREAVQVVVESGDEQQILELQDLFAQGANLPGKVFSDRFSVTPFPSAAPYSHVRENKISAGSISSEGLSGAGINEEFSRSSKCSSRGQVLSGKMDICDVQWQAFIYPTGVHNEFISLYLQIVDWEMLPPDFRVRARMRLSVEHPMDIRQSCTKITEHVFMPGATDWGFTRFVSFKELLAPQNGYIHNDVLTIRCDVVCLPQHHSTAGGAGVSVSDEDLGAPGSHVSVDGSSRHDRGGRIELMTEGDMDENERFTNLVLHRNNAEIVTSTENDVGTAQPLPSRPATPSPAGERPEDPVFSEEENFSSQRGTRRL